MTEHVFAATSSREDPAALSEIWHSFTSLLRSYVAAAELHRPPPHTNFRAEATRFTLDRGESLLQLDQASGRWSLSRESRLAEQGYFSIGADSRISWQARSLELDVAVELITDLFFSDDRESDPEDATEAAGEAGGE